MKKIVPLLCMAGLLYASDPVTIDSLFKKQIGLRSTTSLSILNTGNSNSYMTYPNLSMTGDPIIWNDTKQLNLTQTFMYALSPKFDLLASFSGSYARREYTDIRTYEFKHQDKSGFDSMWLGFIYTADRIGELVPQMVFQTAIIQRERAIDETKNFNFKSYSLKGTLRGYSDPVIYSIYSGFGYNAERKFESMKIKYGHSFYFGGNLSIALSPKITLDMGAEQRYQLEQKINGNKNSNVRSIPTYSIGSTYSINEDTAVSFSADLGGSSSAPDSIFGISIWKKF